MSESTPINVQAFQPNAGGVGKRLSVTSVSASVAIPGLAGGGAVANSRVLIGNDGLYTAFVRLGDATVAATTDCHMIQPGDTHLLTPPFTGPGALYLAAITEESGTTTKINVISGLGT